MNNSNVSEVFNQPAIKLWAKQLQNSIDRSEDQNSWLLTLKNTIDHKERTFPVYLIWLQGNIHNIINPSTLILKDSSGLVKVTNCDKIAGGSQWIQRGILNTIQPILDVIILLYEMLPFQGLYCSVIGELVSSSHTPCVQASKITSLDSNPNLESLWAWEIQDLGNYLTTDPAVVEEDDFEEYNF